MPTAINNRQVDLGGDLVMGDGTSFSLTEDFLAWWAAPQVRTTDVPRSNRDGYLAGRDLFGKHTTNIKTRIVAASESALGDRIDEWKYACRKRTTEVVALRANVLGRTRLRYGRFRIPGEIVADTWAVGDDDEISGVNGDLLTVIGTAQFESLDSLTYGDEEFTASTPKIADTGGFTFPATFPLIFAGGGSTGSITVTNHGNSPVPWHAQLTGDLLYPEITHVESGRRLSLTFTANGGVDLGATDTLDLYSGIWWDAPVPIPARSVLLNGTADRKTQLRNDSTWWDLDPGDNTFTLAADAGAGELAVYWRDGWLS